MTTDKELIQWYLKGWEDEMDGSYSVVPSDTLITKAYIIGANHAVLGDEVRSFDNLTEEEILKIIKNGI